jgi:signal transduction histidine kinase
VALEVRVPEGGPALGAREAGLGGLVLANLVQNAIEASPEAGVVRVDVRPAPEGALDVRVVDHGAGLPAEVAAEPFRPRRSTKPDGAGIGLAISHELARHAGGRIELVRTGISGTEFRVLLPGLARRPSHARP